jgi:hypothetical protein
MLGETHACSIDAISCTPVHVLAFITYILDILDIRYIIWLYKYIYFVIHLFQIQQVRGPSNMTDNRTIAKLHTK